MASRRCLDWKVLASRTVLEDPWIRVRAESCETPGGARIDPFYVLDYPDWVHVLALDPARRVLLVRQYRRGIARDSWELPGGCIDPADASPAAAARRELREETGHDAAAFEEYSVLSPNSASQTNRLYAFLARGAFPAGAVHADPREEVEWEWRSLEDTLDMVRSGEFSQALHVSSLLQGLWRLGTELPRWKASS